MKTLLVIACALPALCVGCSSASDGHPSASSAAPPAAAQKSGRTVFAFDRDQVGGLPPGWKAESTQQQGSVAGWKVIDDDSAPSKSNVLSLTSANHGSGGTFNLCWTDRVQFQDGRIELSLKANSGVEDQGGGPIWRVQDKDNYYVCRANPLENNFRLYYVKAGSRTQIATADAKLSSGRWHKLEIEHHGEHIVCFLNGEKLLDATDNHIPGPGGIGVWTKADAASSFDDIIVTQ